MAKAGERLTLLVCLLAGAVLIAPRISLGQATGLATLSGTVTDPSGAAVPGVQITATNTATGVSYKTQTNSQGIYHIGALPIGPYTMTAEKKGFKKWQRGLTLEVGQNAAVDLALAVGAETTTVEVTGAPPVLNTTGGQVSDVKDYQRISQLPLNGRTVGNLFQLSPGVSGDAGGARVNGMKVGSLGIQLDGITERDRFGGGMVRVQPDVQDIQEFAVDTSGSNARYANPSTVILKTRSGTNNFHGALFETNRNATGALQARLRQQTGTFTIPKENRNEFGGNLGGPVWIPHLYNGHDKTFFFFSYEGLREISRSTNTPESTLGSGGDGNIVPTQAMWNGDFSNAFNANDGQPIIIYDPFTTNAAGQRTAFPGNVIPTGRMSQIAKELAAITQRPTNNNNPYVADNMTAVYPSNTNGNKFMAKVDENFSPKDRLSVRWSRDTQNDTIGGGVFGNPASPSDGFGTSRQNSSVTNVDVDYNRTISNTSLNELILGVLRTPTGSGTLADFTDWAGTLGLPNPFGVTGWPTLCAGCDYCWDSDNRKDEDLTTYHAADNFTWVKGKHTLEFGGEFSKEQNNVRELQQAQGSHDFGPGWTCNFDPVAQACFPDTGDGFATLFLGVPDFLSNQFNRGFFYFRQNHMAAYINDEWRMTHRLTLNLGMRWDKFTPYSEKENRLDTAPLPTITNSFLVLTPDSHAITTLPNIPASVLQSWAARGLAYTTADTFGYPSDLFAADNNNFGPRVGAAFKINNKTVIRGGYGIYYWPMPLSQILQTGRTNPPLNLRFENDFLGPGPFGYAPATGANPNYVISSVPSPANLLPVATVNTTGIVTISPRAQSIFPWAGEDWQDDRMQNWNVTFERELPTNTALRLTYTGNHGSSLEQRRSINSTTPQLTFVRQTGMTPAQFFPAALYSVSANDLLRPNPQWNVANGFLAHDGFSNSNSIQAQVEHKYRSGIVFQAFYVYTHALATTDAGGFTSGNASINGGGSLSGGGGGQAPEIRQVLGQPALTDQQLLDLVYYSSTSVPVQHYGWNGLFDLPFGAGKKWLGGSHGVVNQLVGGWQVAFLGSWDSGFWMSPSTSLLTVGDPKLDPSQRFTFNYNGAESELWFKGNIVPANASDVPGGMSRLTNLFSANPAQNVVHPYGPDCSGTFSGSIAVTLADGTCFDAPTNDFYNPSTRGTIETNSAFSMDASLYKNFSLWENAKLRFESDFFNVFNHPTDNQPSPSTGLIDLTTQANTPRILQFSLQLVF